MEYRFVGSSSLKVSALSVGTATFGGGNSFFRAWGETGVEEAAAIVETALDAGVTMFDSADVYSDGLAEQILGKAIGRNRDRLLISTKASFRTNAGPDGIGSSRKHLVAACEASLRRLGTDRIDLWQLHAFDAMTPIEETMRAMNDLVRAGKVRFVGCSNFSGWHLMKSLSLSDKHGWARHVAHQAHYCLLAREYEWELMPLALDQNVGTVVWSPLAGGRLTGKMGRNQAALPGTRMAALGAYGPQVSAEQFNSVIDVLREIAAEVGRSVSQVALNWLLRRPTVSTLVIGARNARQLSDNLRAVEFCLSQEQMSRLSEVSAPQLVYPYWHQRETFLERNPPAVV